MYTILTHSLSQVMSHGRNTLSLSLSLPPYFLSRLSPSEDLAIAVYLSFTGLASVMGNAMVLLVFGGRWGRLRPPELMTMNLAVCDFGYSLLGSPFIIYSSMSHGWVWGWGGCVWYGLQGFVFGIGSLLTTALVSLDRCLKICSVRYGQWVERQHVVLVISALWLYTLAWALLPVFGFGSYGPEPFGTSCTVDWWKVRSSSRDRLYVCLIMSLCFGVPTLLIIGSYIAILLQVQRSGRSLAAIPASTVTHNRKEMRLTKIAAVICASFLLSWTPYVVVSLFSTLMGGGDGESEREVEAVQVAAVASVLPFGTTAPPPPLWANHSSAQQGHPFPTIPGRSSSSNISPGVSVLPALLAKSHCIVNPFIYQVMNREFRSDVYRILSSCCGCLWGDAGGRRRRRRGKEGGGEESESVSQRGGQQGSLSLSLFRSWRRSTDTESSAADRGRERWREREREGERGSQREREREGERGSDRETGVAALCWPSGMGWVCLDVGGPDTQMITKREGGGGGGGAQGSTSTVVTFEG
ncbi:opsin 9 [Amia ocellicauda]|uniref:opsin 9 n=1 Tax=Amia ocellicauda TaxID=2972642 RepID=UPI003463F085